MASLAEKRIADAEEPSVDPQARPDVTVRGPVSYAGPGSLGGTSSGFRRG